MSEQGSPNGNSDAGFGLLSYAERQHRHEQEERAKGTATTIEFHPDGARLVPAVADPEDRK